MARILIMHVIVWTYHYGVKLKNELFHMVVIAYIHFPFHRREIFSGQISTGPETCANKSLWSLGKRMYAITTLEKSPLLKIHRHSGQVTVFSCIRTIAIHNPSWDISLIYEKSPNVSKRQFCQRNLFTFFLIRTDGKYCGI